MIADPDGEMRADPCHTVVFVVLVTSIPYIYRTLQTLSIKLYDVRFLLTTHYLYRTAISNYGTTTTAPPRSDDKGNTRPLFPMPNRTARTELTAYTVLSKYLV